MSATALYTYWRSTAAYRVRIALRLKGIDYASIPVHLLRGGGEQKSAEFRARNPQGLVPVLAVDDVELSQSLAIIEYLEETRPDPALLPSDPAGRARVRGLAMIIACDIHPICNLRVLKFLGEDLGGSDVQRSTWIRHWIGEGFRAIETRLVEDGQTGAFCHGDSPGLADICLVPAGIQRQSIRVLTGAIPHDQPDQRCLPSDRGLQHGCAREPAQTLSNRKVNDARARHLRL